MSEVLDSFLATLDPYYPYKVVRCKIPDKGIESIVEKYWLNCSRVVLVEKNESDAIFVCLQQPMISKVFVDFATLTLVKRPHSFLNHGILQRELHWLSKLSDSTVTPKLLGATERSITMSYVGEPVFEGNLPDNWRAQSEQILLKLQESACRHNDIKCENLMVLDGKIHLIDFGWSTAVGDTIPSDWPAGIGRQHRLDVHMFDDSIAIYDALKSAESDCINRSIQMPADVVRS